MVSMNVHVLNSVEELVAIADRWNDLWDRSEVTCPPSRAEPMATWLARFAPGYRFRAIVVESGQKLVAALPIVTQPWANMLPVGALPRNQWCGAGDLLVDASADIAGATRHLADALNQLPWMVYRFSFVCPESRTWRQFAESLTETGCQFECRPSHDVTRIEIPSDWESYRRTWSADHRYRIRRAWQKLSKQGEVQLKRFVPENADEAEPLLRQVMAIEDAGWKGREGTSLLKAPHMADFVLGMSESLTARRELEIACLQLNNDIIAAEILWNAKGVLHGYKTGYDERFRKFAPGHLLMHEILRDASARQRCHTFDCIGPTSEALQHWRGSTYRIGQFTVAPRRWVGQALFFLYGRFWRPTLWRNSLWRPFSKSECGRPAPREELAHAERDDCDSLQP